MKRTVLALFALLSLTPACADDADAELAPPPPALRSGGLEWERHGYLHEDQIADVLPSCPSAPPEGWDVRVTDQPVQPGWTIVQVEWFGYLPADHAACIVGSFEKHGVEEIGTTGEVDGYTGVPDGNASSEG